LFAPRSSIISQRQLAAMSFVGMPPTGAEEKRRAEKQRQKRVPPRRVVDVDPPPKPLYAAFDGNMHTHIIASLFSISWH
jgi:hypothetical protein